MNLNLFNILILMGVVQGFIFGLVVLFGSKYFSKTNSYLAFTVLSLSFSNLQYWFLDSKLYMYYPFLNILRIPCEFLIIPMFYLFVNFYLENSVSIKKKVLLVMPFFIDFFLQIIVSINKLYGNQLIKDKAIYFYLVIEESSSFFLSMILIIITLIEVKKYEQENFTFDKVKAKTKWLYQILSIGLFACVFWFVEIYYMTKNSDEGTSIYYPIWIVISIVIYWLSYVGIFQSSIFSERKAIRNKFLYKKKTESVFLEKQSQSKEAIFLRFEEIIRELYLNPTLCIDDVSKELLISSNYLSQIINSRGMKFNDYLNSVRIEKAKVMLKNDDFLQYTITSIGLESGFNSNASFYRAFKKHTGHSPNDYRRIS